MKLSQYDFLQKCLAQAVFDVFELMVGIVISQVQSSSDNSPRGRGDITGVMMIEGDRKAMLYLTLSQENAGMIISYMTGNNACELSEEELHDGVAELVNMIAGRAKALLAGTSDHYTISPPFTIVGLNHYIVYKKEVSKFIMMFSVGDATLYLGLTYF